MNALTEIQLMSRGVDARNRHPIHQDAQNC
jgi:hypothetical protein